MGVLYRACCRLNELVGRAASWLTLLLVLITVSDVFSRYLFHSGSVAVQELEWHLFALIFLLGAAFTLREDAHVRVDVFYGRFSERTKAWVNIFGTIFFLFPFCVVVIWASIPFVGASYNLGEISPDAGGLPFRFLLKAAIPLGFLLLALQGVAVLIDSLNTVTKPAGVPNR